MSLTDEMMSNMAGKTPGAAKATGKVTKQAAKYAAKYAVKGLCLILGKGVPFTEHAVMQAVKKVAFVTTGNVQFSNRNIDIDKFQKNKDVKMVGSELTAEVMKYFDRHCKRFGVKYSAVHNTKENNYTIFFEGKHSETILKVMREAFKDYSKAMEKQKGKGKQKEADRNPEKKDSIKAKLAFFRNRVKARDAEREKDAVEKNHHRSDRER